VNALEIKKKKILKKAQTKTFRGKASVQLKSVKKRNGLKSIFLNILVRILLESEES
jgi:hypothetical protein